MGFRIEITDEEDRHHSIGCITGRMSELLLIYSLSFVSCSRSLRQKNPWHSRIHRASVLTRRRLTLSFAQHLFQWESRYLPPLSFYILVIPESTYLKPPRCIQQPSTFKDIIFCFDRKPMSIPSKARRFKSELFLSGAKPKNIEDGFRWIAKDCYIPPKYLLSLRCQIGYVL